ncbi:MAG: hypothetical protein ACLPYB_09550 [Desulfobaccales bacterium]
MISSALLLVPIFPPYHHGRAAGEQKAKEAQPPGHHNAVHGQGNLILLSTNFSAILRMVIGSRSTKEDELVKLNLGKNKTGREWEFSASQRGKLGLRADP